MTNSETNGRGAKVVLYAMALVMPFTFVALSVGLTCWATGLRWGRTLVFFTVAVLIAYEFAIAMFMHVASSDNASGVPTYWTVMGMN